MMNSKQKILAPLLKSYWFLKEVDYYL